MDKCTTKLIADQAGVRQADWLLVTKTAFDHSVEAVCEQVAAKFSYPVFVKPAGTGSSVGVSKARCREDLVQALISALSFDRKVLVEEFIDGQEVECAVLGNATPAASVCGEVASGLAADVIAAGCAEAAPTPASLLELFQKANEAILDAQKTPGREDMKTTAVALSIQNEKAILELFFYIK